MLLRRTLMGLMAMAGAAVCGLMPAAPAVAETDAPAPSDWPAVLQAARGQTVYFNAWGGDALINDYIAWVGEQVRERFGIELVHVKLADTADAVTRVLTEKSAGRDRDGTIDLIWINGENFAAMKQNGLLFGPFAEQLPNFALVDVQDKPTTVVDFTVPVEGMEAPWGMAQFVFIHDSARVTDPPTSMDALADWIRANPGRFTYPRPPDFIGSTFLKQILLSAITPEQRPLLDQPPGADADALTQRVFDWLDATHPAMWQEGRDFPNSGPDLQGLFADGGVDMALAFNPAEAGAKVAAGVFPETTRSFVLAEGTVGNTHFVAIPYNAAHKAGAMVVANFLMSPDAQARKADPSGWADATVLDLDALSPEDRALFDALPRRPATLPPEALGRTLPEPHPGWMELLERQWAERYQP